MIDYSLSHTFHREFVGTVHHERTRASRRSQRKVSYSQRTHQREWSEKFHMLRRCIPITGVYGMKGTIGYNTNKGGDIAVCLDGAPNEIFHVLLHELAHCTVKEYDHTDTFWKNYIELRDMCVELNVYTKIPERTPLCGEHVQDK